ncbi:hypothetical protein P6U16_20165 [Rhizobium sp. 32-5/1]|nr:hypothetical protein [Rhizobium sp. 32-5/1]WEZ83161.1 hypothetical protein P6U16_20165 [Rhizobium sp. 32-5/1]
MSSNRQDDPNRQIEKLIRRERLVWIAGVTFPVMLLIALFIL